MGSKVTFARGEKFLLQEEFYNAVLIKVEEVKPKNASATYPGGYKFTFEIMDKEKLQDGEGTSFKKKVNTVFWANSTAKDGSFVFPLNGKFKNTCLNIAKSKKIDIEDDDFVLEDLVGGYCKVVITNDKDKSTGEVYSNINNDNIREASSKTKDAYQEWKEASDDEDEDEVPKKKKKVVDEDDEDEVPKKKKKVVEDDDDLFD